MYEDKKGQDIFMGRIKMKDRESYIGSVLETAYGHKNRFREQLIQIDKTLLWVRIHERRGKLHWIISRESVLNMSIAFEISPYQKLFSKS